MEELPFFSIVTPVYNCQKYLGECIKSVMKQTYSSWELILVDDGSTDDSGKICDEYCRCDPRIRVIHQNNLGGWVSRLNGMEIVKGKYTLGLDSDDYFEQECLEVVKNAIDITDSDLIFFGARCVGGQHGIISSALESQKIYTQKEIINEVIRTTNHALWNKAIRSDKVKRSKHIKNKKKLGITTDYATLIPILCEIDTGYVIKDVLYNYRVRRASSSHSCKVSDIWDIDYSTAYAIYHFRRVAILDADMRNQIYLSYLKRISSRIYALFSEKGISADDCKKLHRSRVYINSKKFERRNDLSKREYQTLKLFRYSQYWLLQFRLLNKHGI